MRIGIVTPSWPGENSANGIATVHNTIAVSLAKLGHEIHVFASESAAHSPVSGVTFHPISATESVYEKVQKKLSQTGSVELKISSAVKEVNREQPLDALIMEETWGWAASVQKLTGVPVVCTLHGPWFYNRDDATLPDDNDMRRIELEKKAFIECQLITSPSKAILDETTNHYETAPISSRVIHSPINPSKRIDFTSLTERQKKSFLFVGRFDRHKGGDIVLDAFERLIERGADAYLTFVGPDRGIPVPSVRDQKSSDKLSIDEYLQAMTPQARARIEYLGPQPKAEIEMLRQKHFACICSSRWENFGTAILESMAAGSATVATNVGGSAEIIEHGKSGILVTPQNPTAICDACEQLLNDPSRAATLGHEAREAIIQRFNPEKICHQWETAISSMA